MSELETNNNIPKNELEHHHLDETKDTKPKKTLATKLTKIFNGYNFVKKEHPVSARCMALSMLMLGLIVCFMWYDGSYILKVIEIIIGALFVFASGMLPYEAYRLYKNKHRGVYSVKIADILYDNPLLTIACAFWGIICGGFFAISYNELEYLLVEYFNIDSNNAISFVETIGETAGLLSIVLFLGAIGIALYYFYKKSKTTPVLFILKAIVTFILLWLSIFLSIVICFYLAASLAFVFSMFSALEGIFLGFVVYPWTILFFSKSLDEIKKI
ncbi:MAG: hypothetical protein K5769_02550 [Pseudobutyrivibrio sp.]|nr:hypothetical protein [Pseudobutyrivibrio sp.]